VQSYIDARSLEEHVKSGRRFSEADLKEIAIQILEILDYLHHCQPPVIHRDIKPSNILLAESDVGVGLVYLVDFGSVQSLAAREGSTITIVGTYGYMPPEQFGGRAYPTSDFYSLGATLIYLATGKHPADIPQGKDLRLNFGPLANLSPDMNEWIRAMIHPIADERPNSARESIRSLQNTERMTIQKIETSNPEKIYKYSRVPRPENSRIKIDKDFEGFEGIILSIPANQIMQIMLPTEILTVILCAFVRGTWLVLKYFFYLMIVVCSAKYFLVSIIIIMLWEIVLKSRVLKSRKVDVFKDKFVEVKICDKFIKIDAASIGRDCKSMVLERHKIWQIVVGEDRGHPTSITLKIAETRFSISCRFEEGHWLAAELSHVLKLPIDIVDVTPSA
jgi:Protein kinase domain